MRAHGCLIAIVLVLAGCGEGAPEPAFAPPARPASEARPASGARLAPEPSAPRPEPSARPPEPGPTARTQPTPGRWYTLDLPASGSRAISSSPEVIDAVYVIDPAEHVSLTVFRPMPQQTDLEAWTTATESLLDGIPRRQDDAVIGEVPARIGVFEGELRWTFVADGMGGLIKCFAEEPHDEAWLHEACDPVVQSIRLVRPIHD